MAFDGVVLLYEHMNRNILLHFLAPNVESFRLSYALNANFWVECNVGESPSNLIHSIQSGKDE